MAINFDTIFYHIFLFLTGDFFSLEYIQTWWDVFRVAIAPYSFIVSIILMIGIVYCMVRLSQIRTEESLAFKMDDVLLGGDERSAKNPRWEHVMELVHSNNPGDWRVAIIEADSMLDEMVQHMGYHGEHLGERLKVVEKSDFQTIDLAWEAHKVRNQIAHEGSQFSLTEREAKRVISLYEAVFKEFLYV